MAIFNVSDSAGLSSALNAAQGGDTIRLAAGNYGELDVDGKNFNADVTITSADPNNPATLGRVHVENSSNVVFDRLQFEFSTNTIGKTVILFRTDDASNITLSNSLIQGAQDSGGFGLGVGVGIGGGSENVVILNNEITSVHYGIATGGATGTQVVGNEIHNFSADGIQMISVKDMLIEGNFMHTALKPPSSGVHQDFIQLFSRANSNITEGLTIRNNILDVAGERSHQ